jgi:gamma-glutamylcysteine synthetase
VLSCNAGLRIGTEHEKLGYNTADNTRIGYDVIQKLLQGLCDRFGWQPVAQSLMGRASAWSQAASLS